MNIVGLHMVAFSNTAGRKSKSTLNGSIAEFAVGVKTLQRKNLVDTLWPTRTVRPLMPRLTSTELFRSGAFLEQAAGEMTTYRDIGLKPIGEVYNNWLMTEEEQI